MVEQWPLLGLTAARCAGVFLLAPPGGWRHFPVTLRLAVAGVLAVPLSLGLAVRPSASVVSPATYLGMVVSELAVGLVVGIGLWLLVAGLQAGGHMLDRWAPGCSAEEEGPWATFFGLLAVVFFLQLGGLEWLLVFLRQSLAVVPPGGSGALALSGAAAQVRDWPGLLLLTALRTAAPVVLALLLAGAMTASLERCFPPLPLADTGTALWQVWLLLVLVAVAPLAGAWVLGEMDCWAGAIIGAVRLLAG